MKSNVYRWLGESCEKVVTTPNGDYAIKPDNIIDFSQDVYFNHVNICQYYKEGLE